MPFEQTLKAVQVARAVATVCASTSIVMFSFLTKLRRDSRLAFLKDLQDQAGQDFEIGIPSYSAWGNLALVGVCLLPVTIFMAYSD